MGGRQVAAEQVIPARYFRPRHIRGPAGGLAERELDEPGRDLAGIDRLDPKAPAAATRFLVTSASPFVAVAPLMIAPAPRTAGSMPSPRRRSPVKNVTCG
jgi:hypothetical protein